MLVLLLKPFFVFVFAPLTLLEIKERAGADLSLTDGGKRHRLDERWRKVDDQKLRINANFGRAVVNASILDAVIV